MVTHENLLEYLLAHEEVTSVYHDGFSLIKVNGRIYGEAETTTIKLKGHEQIVWKLPTADFR